MSFPFKDRPLCVDLLETEFLRLDTFSIIDHPASISFQRTEDFQYLFINNFQTGDSYFRKSLPDKILDTSKL